MDDASLRRLSRADLLEILVALSEENDRLAARVDELERRLADRELRFRETGSLAELAAEVSGLLVAAQRTADLYLENLGVPRDGESAPQTGAIARPTSEATADAVSAAVLGAHMRRGGQHEA